MNEGYHVFHGTGMWAKSDTALCEISGYALVSCFLTAGFRYINQLRSGARLHGLIMATTTLEGKVLMGK